MRHEKNPKIILLVLLAAVALGAVLLGSYLKKVGDYQQAVRDLTVEEVPLTDVADGTYQGECDVDFIRARVAVTVKGAKSQTSPSWNTKTAGASRRRWFWTTSSRPSAWTWTLSPGPPTPAPC